MGFKKKLNKETKEMEDEPFKKHFLADTEEEAEKLLKEFDYTIALLANKYATVTGLSEDDLKQEAIIGLARAARDFDIDRSEKFKIFAIYRIKDSLRSFTADQGIDISIPQYLIDTTNVISKIYKLLLLLDVDVNDTYTDIYSAAQEYCIKERYIFTIDGLEIKENDNPFIKAEETLKNAVTSLENLAIRSKTTVKELIRRSETIPAIRATNNTSNSAYLSSSDNFIDEADPESSIAEYIMTETLINSIKKIISERDYNLLVEHIVEGKTVRELGEQLNITAASATIKINKILNTVRKGIKQNECIEDFKNP